MRTVYGLKTCVKTGAVDWCQPRVQKEGAHPHSHMFIFTLNKGIDTLGIKNLFCVICSL